MLAGERIINGDKGPAFLPDDYCQDTQQNRASARKLLPLKIPGLAGAR